MCDFRQRIEEQLQQRRERLEKALVVMDTECRGRIPWEDFKHGMKTAGLLMAETDYKAVWTAAGGGVRRDGVAEGEMSIDALLTRIATREQQQLQPAAKAAVGPG